METVHSRANTCKKHGCPSPRVEIVQQVDARGPWKRKMEEVWLPGGLSDGGRAERAVSHVTAHWLVSGATVWTCTVHT